MGLALISQVPFLLWDLVDENRTGGPGMFVAWKQTAINTAQRLDWLNRRNSRFRLLLIWVWVSDAGCYSTGWSCYCYKALMIHG
jgi:hypothetical protein